MALMGFPAEAALHKIVEEASNLPPLADPVDGHRA